MDLILWGKTIISIKRYLERVSMAIDSLIYKKALASGYVSIKNLTEQSAYSVSDAIINLTDRKVNLINLNTICSKALSEIDQNSAKILILKYIDCLSSSQISSLLEISDRTYFRKLNLAYENLANWLKRNNFNEEYFQKKYKNEGWIMEVFYKNKEIKEKKDVDIKFLDSMMININKKILC